jgi:hypothetical protein
MAANNVGLESTTEALGRLSELTDGWNGYGAPAPAPVAIRSAEAFVSICQGEGFVPTRIAPSAVGGVGITYRVGARKGYLEFYNDGSTALLLADDLSQQLKSRSVVPTNGECRTAIEEIRAYVDGHPR